MPSLLAGQSHFRSLFKEIKPITPLHINLSNQLSRLLASQSHFRSLVKQNQTLGLRAIQSYFRSPFYKYCE